MHNKQINRCLWAVVFVVFGTIKSANSSPWLQKPRRLEILNNIMIFSTKDEMENMSQIMFKRRTTTTEILSLYYNTYMEYGVSQNNTVGFNMVAGLFDVTSTHGQEQKHASVYGIPFIELFYRRSIIRYKNFIWSIEPTIKMPAISGNDEVSREIFKYQKQTDFEIKTSFGFSFNSENNTTTGLFGADGHRGHFMGGSIAYRHRTEIAFDELRLNLLYGFHVNKYLTLIVEFLKIFNISKVEDPKHDKVYSNHFGKLTLYIVANLNEQTSIVTGIVIDIAQNMANINMNSYGGTGVLVGFWQKI